MKKPTHRLVVRRENIRTLAALELSGVGGGEQMLQYDSTGVCTAAVEIAAAQAKLSGV